MDAIGRELFSLISFLDWGNDFLDYGSMRIGAVDQKHIFETFYIKGAGHCYGKNIYLIFKDKLLPSN